MWTLRVEISCPAKLRLEWGTQVMRVSEMMETEDNLVSVRESERKAGRRTSSAAARIIGVLAAILIIMGQYGPSYLMTSGKILFWSGLVLAPLFLFNKDVLGLVAGKVIYVSLLLLHSFFVVHWFGFLGTINLFVLAVIALIEVFAFFLPFMLVRRQHTGSWY